MAHFHVAGLQIGSRSSDMLLTLERETARFMGVYPWVQMVVFPELAAYGPELSYAEALPGPAEDRFCALARKQGVWLIAGSIYERCGDKVYNTTPVINPAGEVVARYRKRYPFLPYEAGVTPGDQPCVFDVPGVGRFGISICYDQWFPETTRELAWLGAEVVINPTLTGTIDREQELVIARANAIVNQCYYININQSAPFANGRSICLGPDGDVLHQSGEQPEFMPLVLDLERVRHARRSGLMNIGQPLKSFRDGPTTFACYGANREPSPSLDALGPLQMPGR